MRTLILDFLLFSAFCSSLKGLLRYPFSWIWFSIPSGICSAIGWPEYGTFKDSPIYHAAQFFQPISKLAEFPQTIVLIKKSYLSHDSIFPEIGSFCLIFGGYLIIPLQKSRPMQIFNFFIASWLGCCQIVMDVNLTQSNLSQQLTIQPFPTPRLGK